MCNPLETGENSAALSGRLPTARLSHHLDLVAADDIIPTDDLRNARLSLSHRGLSASRNLQEIHVPESSKIGQLHL